MRINYAIGELNPVHFCNRGAFPQVVGGESDKYYFSCGPQNRRNKAHRKSGIRETLTLLLPVKYLPLIFTTERPLETRSTSFSQVSRYRVYLTRGNCSLLKKSLCKRYVYLFYFIYKLRQGQFGRRNLTELLFQ